MLVKIFPPFALELHYYGLSKIFNNSFGDYIKERIEGSFNSDYPIDNYLHQTMSNGFLFQLGMWLNDELYLLYSISQTNDAIGTRNFLWKFYNFLAYSGLGHESDLLDLYHFLDEMEGVYIEKGENIYKRTYEKNKWNEYAIYCIEHVSLVFAEEIMQISRNYAANYAERVFHDRQLCELLANYITYIFSYKGAPFRDVDGRIAVKRVERRSWPAWTMATLHARERGRCSKCGKSFDELEGQPQIDHIVPLVMGGCNDLVNLQILCDECNKKKGGKNERVNSSIPTYLNWKKSTIRRLP